MSEVVPPMAGPRPPQPGAWRPPGADSAVRGRRPVPLGRTLLRALDPRLTRQVRAERAQFEALAARLRPGSSVAVVGLAPQAGRSTVTAVLALALAQHQSPLTIDTGAGVYGRLARWPGGSAHAVLTGIGVRGVDPDGPRPPGVGYRWLRQRLALSDEVMLLGSDPSLGEAPVAAAEYPATVRALGRWFSVLVTDTPRLSNESVVPAAVALADCVVVVGPDDDHGGQWVSTCLPWIASVGSERVGQQVLGVLVQHEEARTVRTWPDFPIPMSVLPFDPALARPGPVTWYALAERTRDAATALAAQVASALRAPSP